MAGNILGGLIDFGKNIFKDFKATDFLDAGGDTLRRDRAV